MLLSFFRLALAIRNVWPQPMNLKMFSLLYCLLLMAAVPITLLECIPYGLFGIPVAVCIYSMIVFRETMPKNVFMGMIGCILAVAVENFLTIFFRVLILPTFLNPVAFSFVINLIYTFLFYWITLFCGNRLKKIFLSGKGIFRFSQTWYVFDAAFLLLITIYLFDNLIPGQNGSVGKMIYNNILHILGYLLVVFFLLLAMRHSYQEQIQKEAKQKALQDLQDYTRNLENMYNSLRSFKHDYINILLSMSGYIEDRNIDELKIFFENKIFPTKNLIVQGDYQLNQLANIKVLEIKSLLAAKMIHAHETGIEIAVDIPDKVESFPIDTVDLVRILGIFLDNAIEAALETEHPQIGLNIIQNDASVSIIINNRFQDKGIVILHKLKQKGFSTKTGHQGIGLCNAHKIISSYENILLQTAIQKDCFIQHIELIERKE